MNKRVNRRPNRQVKILPAELRPLAADELAAVMGGSDESPTQVAVARSR